MNKSLIGYPLYYKQNSYGDWNEFLTYLTAPFSSYSQYVITHKEQIKEAFKSVYGREPSFDEIESIAAAYLWNKENFGDLLKRKDYVLELQHSINKVIPRKIKEDGIFYFQTVAGIRRFQELRGIRPSGRLDKATMYEMVMLSDGNKLKILYDKIYGKSDKINKYILIGGTLILGTILLFGIIKAKS